jgi:hypothetical protein
MRSGGVSNRHHHRQHYSVIGMPRPKVFVPPWRLQICQDPEDGTQSVYLLPVCRTEIARHQALYNQPCSTAKKFWNHFSIYACHPCAGAMLIFSVSFQFYQMSPKGRLNEETASIYTARIRVLLLSWVLVENSCKKPVTGTETMLLFTRTRTSHDVRDI